MRAFGIGTYEEAHIDDRKYTSKYHVGRRHSPCGWWCCSVNDCLLTGLIDRSIDNQKSIGLFSESVDIDDRGRLVALTRARNQPDNK